MIRHNRIVWSAVILGWLALSWFAEVLVVHSAEESPDEQLTTEAALPGRTISAQYMEDQDALDEGKALFRGLCSGCHGGAARGGKGPDLTDSRWVNGDGTDAAIAGIIERGVPGTTMKKLGESLKPEQIAKIIAYIHSLARAADDSEWKPYTTGNSAEGEKLFFHQESQFSCNKCHTLDRRGGGIGPSLDRIASRRSAQYIMESIVNPSQDIDPQFEQVSVLTDDGKAIVGLRINETNFSIQIREQDGKFHSFNKRDLEETKALDTSLMPITTEMLTVKQLHDLFAFLMTKE